MLGKNVNFMIPKRISMENKNIVNFSGFCDSDLRIRPKI